MPDIKCLRLKTFFKSNRTKTCYALHFSFPLSADSKLGYTRRKYFPFHQFLMKVAAIHLSGRKAEYVTRLTFVLPTWIEKAINYLCN